MSGVLERKVTHQCEMPKLPPGEGNATFRFTCNCGAKWEAQNGMWFNLFRPDVWEEVPIPEVHVVPAPKEE